MTPEELLSELTVKIYEEPVSHMRNDGSIGDIDDSLSVFALVVDFETERLMNGILNFFGNSTGLYVNETISALRTIGAYSCAECLGEIVKIADSAGMTYHAIQADRVDQELYAITSWSETHGYKWEQAAARIDALDDKLNVDELWDQLHLFVTQNFDHLSARLQQANQWGSAGGSTSISY